MWAHLWVDETHCHRSVDYADQYGRSGMRTWNALRTPYHDFTSHTADVHREAAVIEGQMVNEDVKPYFQPPQEAVSIYQG
jgi:hypothetical protein